MDSSEGGPSGALKILHRSGKLMGNNRKPMIIIFLSFLLPRYVLLYASVVNITNLALKLVGISAIFKVFGLSSIATIAGILLQSLRTFVLPHLEITAASFLLSSLLSLTVIYAVDAAVKGRKITLKSVLIEIREKLKGVVVTQFYVLFLSLGYMSFSFPLILAVLLLGTLSVGFYFLTALMVIPIFVLLVYLDFVWLQGVVVSIMEEDCEGLTALGKSTDAVKGRRALAFRVNCLLILFAVIVGYLRSLAGKKLGARGSGFVVEELIISGTTLLGDIFSLAVHTLFYEECRRKPIEELGMQEKLL